MANERPGTSNKESSRCVLVLANSSKYVLFCLSGLVLVSCTRFELQQNSKGGAYDYRTLTCNIGKA